MIEPSPYEAETEAVELIAKDEVHFNIDSTEIYHPAPIPAAAASPGSQNGSASIVFRVSKDSQTL
jgi:hypothetical protein